MTVTEKILAGHAGKRGAHQASSWTPRDGLTPRTR